MTLLSNSDFIQVRNLLIVNIILIFKHENNVITFIRFKVHSKANPPILLFLNSFNKVLHTPKYSQQTAEPLEYK